MTTPLQDSVQGMFADVGVSDDFMMASDHPYTCRCQKCLEWWIEVGPDDDKRHPWGPFTVEEIERGREIRSCH